MRIASAGVVAALLLLTPGTPASAQAACPTTPTERVKFVQDLLRQDGASGVMGSIYSQDRSADCEGTAAASTVFLRLDDAYLEFVETGLYYYHADTRPYVFGEYGIFPAPVTFVLDPTPRPLGYWYAFNVSPDGGGSFKWQMSPGTSQTGWTTYGQTPAFTSPVGTPESESAAYTYANGDTYVKDLKYRPQGGSGWFGWGHLGCDNIQSKDPNFGMNTYTAVKLSNVAWKNIPGTPGPGAC